MSEHKVTVRWEFAGESFAYPDYSRDHQWLFDPLSVQASAAPEYLGTAGRADPEQALVAAIASCHMLTLLAIASRKRLHVEAYSDEAVGYMDKNAEGRLAITRVELRPDIIFASDSQVSPERLDRMHELAHQECFIANSVTTEIVVLPPRSN